MSKEQKEEDEEKSPTNKLLNVYLYIYNLNASRTFGDRNESQIISSNCGTVRVRVVTNLAAGKCSDSSVVLSQSGTNRNGTTKPKWDYIIYI